MRKGGEREANKTPKTWSEGEERTDDDLPGGKPKRKLDLFRQTWQLFFLFL